MNNFIYDIPVKVYFGENQLVHLGEELARHGRRVLLVYGGGSIKANGLHERLTAEIRRAGLELFELGGIAPNPRIDSVREGAAICKRNNIDVILAAGGGSTIDAGKWIAAGACTEHDPWDFFTKRSPVTRALPVVTVLTLAATGSEMDCGGVISNPETQDKLARMAPVLLPKASFLDPTLTYSVSAYQTACGAADILSHIMEVYFNMEQDLYMLDCFMEGMMKTVIKYAPTALKEPANYEARANLMWASSWAINGFASGGRRQAWSCHPIEHELSAVYDITHGLGLAILTPRWLAYCLDEATAPKYAQFGVNVFGIADNQEPMLIAKESIARLEEFLFEALKLPRTLSAVGIRQESFAGMAQKACGGRVIPGFKPLAQQDIENILAMCW